MIEHAPQIHIGTNNDRTRLQTSPFHHPTSPICPARKYPAAKKKYGTATLVIPPQPLCSKTMKMAHRNPIFAILLLVSESTFTRATSSLHVLVEGVWIRWIKLLIRPHDGHHVSFAFIDDVVRVSWWNAHNLDFLAAHTILNDGLIWLIDLAKLYKTFPRNNAKLLMLRMVPMLAFDNARLGDVHRNLPAIFCME